MKNKSIHHWLTIAICCGLAASSIGICINSLGVFFTSASAELGVGRGAFALHATISTIIAGLFCPIGMRLINKRNFRVIVSIGIILAGGATMLMSVGDSLWVFYLLGAVRGIGCSFFSLVVITFVIGNWFEEKHGFAVGLTLSFSGLSGAVFSPMFAYLIARFGWRTTYVVMGSAIIALALPGVMFFLDPHPEKKKLLPYGRKTGDAPAASLKNAAGGKADFLSPPFIAMTVLFIFVSSITGIIQHFPGYAESRGQAAVLGAAMVSAAMIGNIVFKLLIGLLSDWLGPISACMVTVSVNVLALTLMSLVDPGFSYAVTLLMAFCIGSIYAVGAVGSSLLTRHVFGVDQYASVYPYISLFIGIGTAASLSIVGFLYDFFGTYRISVIGGIAFGCVNLALLHFLRNHTSTRRKGVDK